jgi:hypothetical protein
MGRKLNSAALRVAVAMTMAKVALDVSSSRAF